MVFRCRIRESMQGFSEQDFDALDAWLQRRSVGFYDVVTLEGFLTAIVIGPNTLMPTVWMPKVWGGRAPKFRDLSEVNRFVRRVMAFRSDIGLRTWTECTGSGPSHR